MWNKRPKNATHRCRNQLEMGERLGSQPGRPPASARGGAPILSRALLMSCQSAIHRHLDQHAGDASTHRERPRPLDRVPSQPAPVVCAARARMSQSRQARRAAPVGPMQHALLVRAARARLHARSPRAPCARRPRALPCARARRGRIARGRVAGLTPRGETGDPPPMALRVRPPARRSGQPTAT